MLHFFMARKATIRAAFLTTGWAVISSDMGNTGLRHREGGRDVLRLVEVEKVP